MPRRTIRTWAYRTLGVAYWLGWLLTLACAFSGKFAGRSAVPGFAWPGGGLFEWITPNARWLLVLTASILAGIQELRSRIGTPWVWKAIHQLLDRFRNHVFSDRDHSLNHHHRVTIFKYHKWAMSCRLNRPWSGWLVAADRSGHTTQTTRRTFLAPDDADRSEGVAGWAWAKNKRVSIHGLPNVTSASAQNELEHYAKETHITLKRLRKEIRICERKSSHMARSFCAFTVEVKGEPWGVIVLDSIDDVEIGEQGVKRFYDVIGPTLSSLLERA